MSRSCCSVRAAGSRSTAQCTARPTLWAVPRPALALHSTQRAQAPALSCGGAPSSAVAAAVAPGGWVAPTPSHWRNSCRAANPAIHSGVACARSFCPRVPGCCSSGGGSSSRSASAIRCSTVARAQRSTSPPSVYTVKLGAREGNGPSRARKQASRASSMVSSAAVAAGMLVLAG